LTLIGGSFTVQGVAVLWMKKLRQRLTEPGPLDPGRIADLPWQFHEAFPHQKERPADSSDRTMGRVSSDGSHWNQ